MNDKLVAKIDEWQKDFNSLVENGEVSGGASLLEIQADRLLQRARDAIPVWVPVSERLPDPEQKVLATYINEYGNQKEIMAMHLPKNYLEADMDTAGDGCWEDNPGDEMYYYKEGWWEITESHDEYGFMFLNGEVTHWMPRPTSPAEKGKD